MSDEKCQRCGDEGEDRRTLWHSCFYEMNELKIPFAQVKVIGKACAKIGTEPFEGFPGLEFPVYSELGDEVSHPFYQLRVCKSCRADWLSAIKEWFVAPISSLESPGTGIWIRENGATKEVTLEEYNKLCYKKQMEQDRN